MTNPTRLSENMLEAIRFRWTKPEHFRSGHKECAGRDIPALLSHIAFQREEMERLIAARDSFCSYLASAVTANRERDDERAAEFFEEVLDEFVLRFTEEPPDAQ